MIGYGRVRNKKANQKFYKKLEEKKITERIYKKIS